MHPVPTLFPALRSVAGPTPTSVMPRETMLQSRLLRRRQHRRLRYQQGQGIPSEDHGSHAESTTQWNMCLTQKACMSHTEPTSHTIAFNANIVHIPMSPATNATMAGCPAACVCPTARWQ
eukprot:m.1413070 g.1413070  ORF g.1413070 m.1413070 type:complete len:120 (-) comp25028_c0_seq116:1560-1919(-)